MLCAPASLLKPFTDTPRHGFVHGRRHFRFHLACGLRQHGCHQDVNLPQEIFRHRLRRRFRHAFKIGFGIALNVENKTPTGPPRQSSAPNASEW